MADPTTVAAREPMRVTLTRTVGIALVVGGVLAWRRGGLARFPLASMLVLWPALGGHFVERWWVAGLAFIAIEIVAHLLLRLTRRPSLFDGRG